MKVLERFARKRRYPGSDERFLKYLYLSDGDIWYRAARSQKSQAEFGAELPLYYASLRALSEQYWSIMKGFAILWTVALLSLLGVIEKASAFGIDLAPQKFGVFFLPAYATLAIYHNMIALKRLTISSVFKKVYEIAPKSEKADILFRFPDAFDFLKYRINHDIVPDQLYIRLRLFPLFYAIFAAVLMVAIAVAGSVWVVGAFSIRVWEIQGDYSYAFKSIVILSIVGILFSYMFAGIAIGKRRYTHMGLIHLINRISGRDKVRSALYFKRISEVRQRMGLEPAEGS